MIINPEWTDVGEDRVPAGQAMGATPREDSYGDSFRTFADSIEVIGRSKWRELSESESVKSLVRKIKNQQRWPSCTANAGVQGFEICWNLTFGPEQWIEFSPISVYKHCGNATSGSSVSCIARTLQTVGCLPADTPGNREWMRFNGLDPDHVMDAVDYRDSYPRGYEETAALFRLDEAYDIDSFDEFMTSLLNGWPVLYGRHGHAILGVRGVQDSRGRWHSEYANSWHHTWGNEGYG